MRILLVNPPCRSPVVLPLGLGYIASTLRNEGHKIEILDINAFQYSAQEVEAILQKGAYDCVGIGGLTSTYKYVKWLASAIKRIRPSTPVIAGNMVSTGHPRLLLENTGVDIAVIDEGEETSKELFSFINSGNDLKDVNGIFYKKEGIVYENPARLRIKNLDALPLPARDLFPVELYISNNANYGFRSLDISAVRGCPYKCIYCSRPFGDKVVYRSPDSLIEEMMLLKKEYRAEYISFVDDMILCNRKWIEELCDKLIKGKAKLKWGGCGRVNLVDAALLQNMKRAGCIDLSYGFESGSQKILDIMNKKVTVEQAEKAVALTRKAGINVVGSFMIGMPGETRHTIRETIDFIKRAQLPNDRFFFVTPFPRTPLYEKAKQLGKFPKNEERYIESLGEMFSTFLVNLTEFSDRELIDLKQESEKEIRKNFSLKVRIRIWILIWKIRIGTLRIRYENEGIRGILNYIIKRAYKRYAYAG